MIDSSTPAASELGRWARPVMPLPTKISSVSPSPLETAAQVLRRDDRGFELGQVALEVLREEFKEAVADDQAEHRVAEELEPLVGIAPVVGDRGVGERFLEKLRIEEAVVENFLAS